MLVAALSACDTSWDGSLFGPPSADRLVRVSGTITRDGQPVSVFLVLRQRFHRPEIRTWTQSGANGNYEVELLPIPPAPCRNLQLLVADVTEDFDGRGDHHFSFEIRDTL